MDNVIESRAVGDWSINVVTLFVEDLAVTKRFYQEVFGLSIVFEDQNSAVFKFKNMMVNLLKITEADELIAPAMAANRESGARFVFTITVEDVDASCEDLVKRGAVLLNGPMDRPWGVRTASFKDPAGHIWEMAT